MGLDVYLKRVLKPEDVDADKHNFYTYEILVSKFKDYAVKEKVNYTSWEEALEKASIDFENDVVSMFGNSDSLWCTFTLTDGRNVKLQGKEIEEEQMGIWAEELVWQSEGANSKFYKANLSDTIVLDLKIVKNHSKKYFKEFDKEFIKKWEEGKTFLAYW